MTGKYLRILFHFLQISFSFCNDGTRVINSYFNEINPWHEDKDSVTENIINKTNIYDEMSSTNEIKFSLEKTDLSYKSESQSNFEDDINFMYEDLTFNNTIPDEVAIEDLKVIKVSADSLSVSWKVNAENVSSYLIQWSKGNDLIGAVNESLSDLNYVIKKLDSCTSYKVEVTPYVTNSTGKSNVVNGTTSKTQPAAPSILTADPHKYNSILSLNISWKAPVDGSSCIKYYRITVDSEIHGNKHHISTQTNNTNILIRHLYACTSYLVTIRAVDFDEADGLASTYQSKPTLAKATIPPKLINSITVPAVTATATTITLNWNVLNVKNNCSMESVHTECNYSYTEGYGYDLRSGKTNYSTKGENRHIVRLVVEDLSPFTRYVCYGWINNEGGRSFPGLQVPVVTKELAPTPPKNFHLLDDTNFTFTWEPAASMPGKLQKYKITFFWEPLYPVPDTCEVIRRTIVDNIGSTRFNYTWNDGEGYSKYIAYIEARTGGGWSHKSNEINFLSHVKGVPDQVTNLRFVTKPQKNDSNLLETKLYWNLPCSLKGQLKHFEISVFGLKADSANHTINSLLLVEPNFKKNDVFNINLGELKPQYQYIFEVSAVINEMDGKGAVARCFTEYPAGIPPQPSKDYLTSITLHPSKIQRTTTSFEILLPLFPDTNGEIEYYAIIISRKDYDYQAAHTRFNSKNGVWPNISSWRESMESDFILPYQASEPYWTPYPNYILDYGSIRAVKFVVGDDNTCQDVSLATKRRLYCNGPLKPDTWYEVRMRAFTNGGYADSPPFAFKTDAEMSVILIVGIVFGILFLGILAAILLARKAYMKRKEKNLTLEENDNQERCRNRRVTMTAQSPACNTAIRTRRRHE